MEKPGLFRSFKDILRRHVAPPRFVLFATVLLGLTAVTLFMGMTPQMAVLVGFDVAALVFLISALPLLNDDLDTMRTTAAANDANRVVLLAITVLTLAVVLIAIGVLVAHGHQSIELEVPVILISLVLAWLFANTIFALHYAHLYYRQSDGTDAGGLQFPDEPTPGYWDFLYFSLVLGMTFQTSDVTIAAPHIRRVVLGQSVAAFFFNMGVLAFSINTLGSL